jgi:hypothetical protein
LNVPGPMHWVSSSRVILYPSSEIMLRVAGMETVNPFEVQDQKEDHK